MRAGLPVIASDVGGIPECVEHGVTGYRVPRGDVGQLTHHVRLLLEDTSLRARIGAAGRERYEREFTLEQMLGRTLAMLVEVLEGRGKTGPAKALAGLRIGGAQTGVIR